MVMGALRSAQDVIEGILDATQALLTSLTVDDDVDVPCVDVVDDASNWMDFVWCFL